MKRLPIIQKEPAKGERLYYRTLAERDGDPSVQEEKSREFFAPPLLQPTAPSSKLDPKFEPPPGVDRRTFLGLMGASMALATGLEGCRRRPEDKIVPFSHQPEDIIPGRPEYFATAMPFYGTAIGLVVESNDGRPTKIEGNRLHPETGYAGGTTAFVQGHVLTLYDPDRSTSATKSGAKVKIDEAHEALAKLGDELKKVRGSGLAIVVTDHRSQTTKETIDALLRALPLAGFPSNAKDPQSSKIAVVRHEAFGRENARIAGDIAMSERVETVLDLGNAETIVSLDGDFLGLEGSPIKASRSFANRRQIERGAMSRVYVAEPCPTITGNASDHRLRTKAKNIVQIAKALVGELSKAGISISTKLGDGADLTDGEKKWVAAAAKDLAKTKGNGVLIVGRRQPPAVHAIAMIVNEALQSRCVSYRPLVDPADDRRASLLALSEAINTGTINTLLILGGNPAFTAPADAGLADAIKKVKTSVHLSLHNDETSKLCTWHIPRAHDLESWSDARSEDGTPSIMQPLIAPMFDGLTDAELIHRVGGGKLTAYDLVAQTYAPVLSAIPLNPFAPPPSAPIQGNAPPEPSVPPPADAQPMDAERLKKIWRKAVFDGVVPNSVFPAKKPTLKNDEIAKVVGESKAPEGGPFEVVFAPCPHTFDGRYANNAWLQELPDPINKVTWNNAACISAGSAKKLGVANGDLLTITVAGATVKVPAVITYGHADESVTLFVGQGRKFEGVVCKNVGVDVGPVRKGGTFDIAAGTVAREGSTATLASTQGHNLMEGRPVVREQTTEEYKRDTKYARELVVDDEEKKDLLNPFGEPWEYNGHKWGMTIDLTTCTGCSACVTACVAENNIVVVGAEHVAQHREMHWIRIDRYFAGKEDVYDQNEDEAHSAQMPMLCQHCENAPCEQVCPVAATTHSPEGINEMTYNRCIGTKYCGNNCPFKVRRFNFFNYATEEGFNAENDKRELLKLQQNPDVTVRSRGVMEKCSFCVQRVQEAKIAAKQLKDGNGNEADINVQTRYIREELVSACQQACPTGAIAFGDLNDPLSAVARSARYDSAKKVPTNGRAYQMLEEINVRPRVMYLGRIRNPNPDLEPPKPAKEGEGKGEPKGSPKKESHPEEKR